MALALNNTDVVKENIFYYCYYTALRPFNGLFSRKTWVLAPEWIKR